jgi:UDP-glucose 4-epimerase
MMDDFGRAHGLKSARLRYFNAAGAAGEIGEDQIPKRISSRWCLTPPQA